MNPRLGIGVSRLLYFLGTWVVSLRYVTWLRPGARLEVLNRVGIPPLMCVA